MIKRESRFLDNGGVRMEDREGRERRGKWEERRERRKREEGGDGFGGGEERREEKMQAAWRHVG